MLWDNVYFFFVKYIFGGYIIENGSQAYYRGSLGLANFGTTTDDFRAINTAQFSIKIFGVGYPLGNYFSLIATIISMVVIVLLCCALIKKIYNICAHIIG